LALPVRPEAAILVPRWFQLTRMYDEVRAGAFKTRSRFDGWMSAGDGWCVAPARDS